MMVFQFVGIQIFSMMYLLLILIIFSLKNKFKSAENDVFKILLIFTIFVLLADIGINYTIKYQEAFPVINNILCRFSIISYQVWSSILMFYVLLLENKKRYFSIGELINKSRIFRFGIIVVFLLAFSSIFVKANYIYDPMYNISYIAGPSTTYTYMIVIIYLAIILFSTVINRNKIGLNKRIPIFIFIMTSLIFLPIQRFNDDVPVIIAPLMSYAIMIMYFTLENPDVKLIKELEQSRKKADEAIKVKTQFLNNISYNIKSPLNTIIGFSELILNEKMSDDAKKDAINIRNASNDLLEMVNNTIDISKIEAESCSVMESNYDLKSMLNNINNYVLDTLNNDKVKFIMNVDEDIYCNLYGDSDKLQRAITNLISNSIKYTNVGKIILSVKQEVKDNSLSYLKFIVEDTGIGIEKEKQSEIFSKFTRIYNKETVGTEGTGLGLCLTREIVNLLNGSIEFESTYGAGSTFIITVLQKIIDDEKIGNFKLYDEKTHKINFFDASAYKILIVDDNKQSVSVLKRMLELYKINADYALTNKEYTNLLGIGNKYDLIFFEDRLANDNVFKLVQTFNSINKDKVKLIGMTFDSFNKTKNYFNEKGYDDCMEKPFDMERLDYILIKYLKNRG